MAKEEIQYDEQGACPCKACKRKKRIKYPRLTIIDGLVYAQCPGCDRYSPYEFLGMTKKFAIVNWNDTMEHHDSNEY